MYHTTQMSTSASADGEGDGEGGGGGTPATVARADVGELVRFLIADRRTREDDIVRERARHEAAHSKRMEEQLSIMREMLEKSATTGSHVRPESTTPNDKLVLTRFEEGDDIEAFLTTFERLMAVYRVEETRWVEKLVP